MTDSIRPTTDATSNAPSNATTNNAGIPVGSDEHSLSAGSQGPLVLHDHYLIEKLAQFNRERVPERVVHAKGGGAFGELVITGDISQYTRAAALQPGARTPALARFSTVAGEQGSPDTWRDPRGFSLKFYTEEGNWDLVGNNTPVFFVRDPIKFPDFIRSQKRAPGSGLRDHDMQWDFWTLSPESAHQVTWLMGDRGIPATWRNMDGFGSHTFQLINAHGKRCWAKFHVKTNQGIEFLTQQEADEMAGANADHHREDLYRAIADGDFPSWTFAVQIMPLADAETYRFNPFDVTKVWSQRDYPLIEVGTLTLNRNPDNFFAQIEQASFEPSNLVPGIGVSPDKMLLGRIFAYADAHRYRIGTNYAELPVNRPRVPVHTYAKEGAMDIHYSAADTPVYAPNSYGGPRADAHAAGDDGLWSSLDPAMVRAAYVPHPQDDDFGQAGTLVRDVLDDAARNRLVENVAGHLLDGVSPPVLARAFEYWRQIDKELGDRIEAQVRAQAGSSAP